MPNQIRLQVYLAKCGIASRRKCEEIISQGRVTVNGKAVIIPGSKVTDEDTVTYDGRKIGQTKQKIYIALHKPSKYLCSTTDLDDRPLAIDLITPVIKQRLFYVGRLDYLTSGIIFFTNDGDFSKKMTHPSTHIEKEYVVTTKDEIPLELMEEFKKGIYVLGERFKMKDFEFKGPRCVHIILEEGKNRELRKVFLSRNVSVKKVHRIRIGNIDLKGIHSGHFRKLTEKEVRVLIKQADAKGDLNIVNKKKSISHAKTVEKQLNALEYKKNNELLENSDREVLNSGYKPKKISSTNKTYNSRNSSSQTSRTKNNNNNRNNSAQSPRNKRNNNNRDNSSYSSDNRSGQRRDNSSYSSDNRSSQRRDNSSYSSDNRSDKHRYNPKSSSGKRSYNSQDNSTSSSGKKSYSNHYTSSDSPGKKGSNSSFTGKRTAKNNGKPSSNYKSGKNNFYKKDKR